MTQQTLGKSIFFWTDKNALKWKSIFIYFSRTGYSSILTLSNLKYERAAHLAWTNLSCVIDYFLGFSILFTVGFLPKLKVRHGCFFWIRPINDQTDKGGIWYAASKSSGVTGSLAYLKIVSINLAWLYPFHPLADLSSFMSAYKGLGCL